MTWPEAGAAGVVGLAATAAGRVVDNAEFDRIGLTDEWIRRRTGIVTRHWFDPGLSLVEPAVAACRPLLPALEAAGEAPQAVLAVTTGTGALPPLAPQIAHGLGLPGDRLLAFDLDAACCGFVHALITALALVDAGQADQALIVTVEAMSRLVDPDDRQTACLFGDGAAACLVARRDDFAPARALSGCDGGRARLMWHDGRWLQLDGLRVFERATRRLADLIAQLAVTPPRPTLVIPHQANGRIVAEVVTRTAELGLPCLDEVAHWANTASASIPLAWASAARDGRVPGTGRLAAVAYGAGETWGGVAVNYRLDITAGPATGVGD